MSLRYNDAAQYIQARLSGLEAQGRVTIALVVGLILVVVAGAVSVLVGR